MDAQTQLQSAAGERIIRQLIKDAEAHFVQLTTERHAVGQEHYGEFTYLDAPTLDMAMEEVADMANYIRYTFVRLFVVRHLIARALEENGRLPTSGFVPFSKMYRSASER